MQKILKVAQREYVETVKTKMFLISVFLTPLLVVGIIFLSGRFMRESVTGPRPARKIAVTDLSNELSAEIERAFEQYNTSHPQRQLILKQLSAEEHDLDARISKLKDEVRKGKFDAHLVIAKDVIKWMDSKKMLVANAGYLYSSSDLFSFKDVGENADLRNKLQGKECRVCALGAVFLTTVDRFNKVGCGDLSVEPNPYLPEKDYTINHLRRDSLTKYLKRYFTPLQMGMIESAFECSEFYEGLSTTALKAVKKAMNYGINLQNNGVNSIDAGGTYNTVYPLTSSQLLTGNEMLNVENNAVNSATTTLIFHLYLR